MSVKLPPDSAKFCVQNCKPCGNCERGKEKDMIRVLEAPPPYSEDILRNDVPLLG